MKRRIQPKLRCCNGPIWILFVLFIATSTTLAGEFQSMAKFRIARNCIIELIAKETHATKGPPSEGRCGYSAYQKKLYMGTGGFAPRSILTRAAVIVDDQRIPLDVSGIANPWLEKPYKPWFHWENKKELGVLNVAFADGAEIYVVTWHVVHGASLKVEMRHLGDEEIPWLKGSESTEPQLN